MDRKSRYTLAVKRDDSSSARLNRAIYYFGTFKAKVVKVKWRAGPPYIYGG